LIYIPDQTEPITLTREEYPDLPFKKVTIKNPRRLREGLFKYYEFVFQKYQRGELNLNEK
jgi:hypothetical protein